MIFKSAIDLDLSPTKTLLINAKYLKPAFFYDKSDMEISLNDSF